jgi:hypothetical protein
MKSKVDRLNQQSKAEVRIVCISSALEVVRGGALRWRACSQLELHHGPSTPSTTHRQRPGLSREGCASDMSAEQTSTKPFSRSRARSFVGDTSKGFVSGS